MLTVTQPPPMQPPDVYALTATTATAQSASAASLATAKRRLKLDAQHKARQVSATQPAWDGRTSVPERSQRSMSVTRGSWATATGDLAISSHAPLLPSAAAGMEASSNDGANAQTGRGGRRRAWGEPAAEEDVAVMQGTGRAFSSGELVGVEKSTGASSTDSPQFAWPGEHAQSTGANTTDSPEFALPGENTQAGTDQDLPKDSSTHANEDRAQPAASIEEPSDAVNLATAAQHQSGTSPDLANATAALSELQEAISHLTDVRSDPSVC